VEDHLRQISGKRKRSAAADKTVFANKTWVSFKCLAELFAKCGRAVKVQGLVDDEDAIGDLYDGDDDADSAQRIGGWKKSRIGLAIPDLWNALNLLHDWKSLADYLSKDHTMAISNVSSTSRGNAKATDLIEECYRLSEEEETILVEVLVACLTLLVTDVSHAKDKKEVRTLLSTACSCLFQALLDFIHHLFYAFICSLKRS
jgi:hypothetical protein